MELLQRIEQLTGVRMELFPSEADDVLLLADRVSEAQRLATMQMREADGGGGGRGSGKRRAGGNDDDGLALSGGAPRKKYGRR